MSSHPEIDTSSERLIDHLRLPDSYPHWPEAVEEIQTHISWVFLVPPYVYKVKKPLSLGFLDFTSLEKRRYYCEQEVQLNRRLCPHVYEGVVPISEIDGRFVLDDASHVVEYAVKMRHLAGGEFAIDRVRNGEFSRADVDRIVEILDRFYGAEPSRSEVAAWGRIDKLKISTDENFEQTRAYVGSLLDEASYGALRYYTNRFYDRNARLLHFRRAGGHILDCHGDLHLEHIYLKPESVCIYDCIEFNERLRYIDVANDVAFLAMDLDYHGCHRLSRYFIARASHVLSDPNLELLADFYKCYRAYVRAKVESIRSDGEEVPDEEREKSRHRAARYYQLALRYAVAGSSAAVIVVMGRAGTGKSTMAARLATALGWEVRSSDRIRKERAGVEPFDRRSADERRELYSSNRTEDTYETLSSMALAGIEQGNGIVLDATYSRRRYRDRLRASLRESHVPYCFLELTAPDDVLRHRLSLRDGDRRSVSDARVEDFEMLSRRYEAPDDLEDAFHIRISTERSESDTLSQCFGELIRLDLGEHAG